MTQEAVAAATGLDRTYIGMVERGERKPTVHAVTLILDVLNVTWTKMGAALDDARREGRAPTPPRS
jgi:transcriptional regulator with XRE-family HTH domain